MYFSILGMKKSLLGMELNALNESNIRPKCHVLLQTFFCLCLIFVFLKIWLDVEWMVAGRFHLRGWLHKTICWPAPSWENCSNKQEASSHRRGDAANLSVGNCQHLLIVEEKKMQNGLRRDKETGGLDQGNPGPEPGFSGSPLSGDTMVIARDFLSLLYFSYHLSVTVLLDWTKGWLSC